MGKRTRLITTLLAITFTAAGCGGNDGPTTPTGPTLGNSAITIQSADSAAGAITSLRWSGMEMVDARDHGRYLQSAFQFEGGVEENNPTEAGSAADDGRNTSTSILLSRTIEGSRLRTSAQMAYWYPYKDQKISPWTISKDVHVGIAGDEQTIQYDVSLDAPDTERQLYAQWEALTQYMPPEMDTFHEVLPDGTLRQIDVTTGRRLAPPHDGMWVETNNPIIASTPDGTHAIGVWCEDPASIYGAWHFPGVSKWNVMVRENNPATHRTFSLKLAVGTREDARARLDVWRKARP